MNVTLEKRLNGTSNSGSRTVEHGDEIDGQVLDALTAHSGGSMCIGSSTGEIHGLTGRVAAIREQAGISMCFWGGFVK